MVKCNRKKIVERIQRLLDAYKSKMNEITMYDYIVTYTCSIPSLRISQHYLSVCSFDGHRQLLTHLGQEDSDSWKSHVNSYFNCEMVVGFSLCNQVFGSSQFSSSCAAFSFISSSVFGHYIFGRQMLHTAVHTCTIICDAVK